MRCICSQDWKAGRLDFVLFGRYYIIKNYQKIRIFQHIHLYTYRVVFLSFFSNFCIKIDYT